MRAVMRIAWRPLIIGGEWWRRRNRRLVMKARHDVQSGSGERLRKALENGQHENGKGHEPCYPLPQIILPKVAGHLATTPAGGRHPSSAGMYDRPAIIGGSRPSRKKVADFS
jgi:hypothetical protein